MMSIFAASKVFYCVQKRVFEIATYELVLSWAIMGDGDLNDLFQMEQREFSKEGHLNCSKQDLCMYSKEIYDCG